MRQWLTALGLAAALAAGCAGTEGTLLVLTNAGAAGGDAGAAGDAPSEPYVPAADVVWQAKLTGPVELDDDAQLFYLDADLQPPETLARLRAEGRRYICYLSAGSLEEFRDDVGQVPEVAVGRPLAEYPDERWLDVRVEEVRSLMARRIVRLGEQGCAGVPPSSLSVHAADSGFALTLDDALAYARFLAERIHAAGMSAGLIGAADLTAELWPAFDFGLAIACLEGTGCAEFSPFTARGKPVLYVEHGGEADAPRICNAAETLGFRPLITTRSFDGQSARCPDIL